MDIRDRITRLRVLWTRYGSVDYPQVSAVARSVFVEPSHIIPWLSDFTRWPRPDIVLVLP